MEEEQVDSSLDFSHLTEAEQSTILQVLQRDLDLRHLDEGRVRVLQETETDPARLRVLSGSWFDDERSKRHRNQMPGSTLVHTSMRHRKTKKRVTDVPLTGLFEREGEETSNSSNNYPEAESRLKDSKDEESEGVKPVPTPRKNSPMVQGVQHINSFSSSKEDERGSNGQSEEAEADFNGDTESLSSCFTEQASLKSSSSTGSLQSGYTLSGSMMSLFSSGDFGMVEVRGRIQFSLVYDTQKEELHVKVFRCEDIASARKDRSDPYVKTYLLPDKSNRSKKKTAVKKKTLNPVYDQTFRYKVRVGELRSRTLNLSVWHAVPLSRNVFLGEVEVSLALWDWTCSWPLWQDLQPRIHLNPDSISSRGLILLSIKFVPDGFEDASRQSGQKTRVVKRSISPTYNHTMVYDGFHSSDLREACAELTVWQREGLKSHVLGGIRLSCGTGGGLFTK
ncbi:Synaptotagmin-like protein 1 [Liparis tanakae]|uniref:Synaptotagmin-like protein 1 n=1 Tax=Liparis tanakae TaxID=230148 RepID=A0A4Z2J7W3_9TELE|nr:Synaptotagmin-like protein 1 [Liparis tanakae]